MLVFLIGMALYFAGTFYLPFSTAMTDADPARQSQLFSDHVGQHGRHVSGHGLGTLLTVLAAAVVPMALAHFVARTSSKPPSRYASGGASCAPTSSPISSPWWSSPA